jgi:hypothetical protein
MAPAGKVFELAQEPQSHGNRKARYLLARLTSARTEIHPVVVRMVFWRGWALDRVGNGIAGRWRIGARARVMELPDRKLSGWNPLNSTAALSAELRHAG